MAGRSWLAEQYRSSPLARASSLPDARPARSILIESARCAASACLLSGAARRLRLHQGAGRTARLRLWLSGPIASGRPPLSHGPVVLSESLGPGVAHGRGPRAGHRHRSPGRARARACRLPTGESAAALQGQCRRPLSKFQLRKSSLSNLKRHAGDSGPAVQANSDGSAGNNSWLPQHARSQFSTEGRRLIMQPISKTLDA
jgi:hypothetical protein